MARLKVGIIGCGGIANGKHLPALKAINRVDIVAFCDLIPDKAEKAAKEAAFTDDEWAALIATKPNWTFALV